MSADQPPPYTSEDEPKIDLAHQPAESGSVSFSPQGDQAAPSQVPSAPPGYEAVAYYLASSSAGNAPAPVIVQPQSQQFQPHLPQQPQVIVVQSPAQMVVVPPGQQHVVAQSFTAHIVLACCSCLCCFSCPFSIISFILARKCSLHLLTKYTMMSKTRLILTSSPRWGISG